ncbi:MAG: DUF4982 domain-containing protein [Pontiellaceae bacterium]|nr:DUF4982 domain-containing protein [Pontiellaceae bacterium]MBN2783530.1 DUF4982 domain-containing protein [Pontiellaceae bacterium]
MLNRFVIAVIAACVCAESSFAQGFGESTLIREWQFHLGDDVDSSTGLLKSGKWRSVAVPHDWSVEQPASADNSSCTGYLPGGIGWYKTDLEIPADQAGKCFYLYFEGVYNRSEVFVNGTFVGFRPNGYVSFMYDVTGLLKPGETNSIYVRVDHSLDADSRWYTGSGIYRPVHLVTANPVHIGQWGVYWTAEVNKLGSANMNVQTEIVNEWTRQAEIEVRQELIAPEGSLAARSVQRQLLDAGKSMTLNQEFPVANPQKWSVASPALYKLKTSVAMNGQIVDHSETAVGIRTLTYDPDKGFALNGELMKVKGVCIHHDAGVLGAAVPKIVWRERLLRLKEIGCNAIRMSHNPQATDVYDLCDELGFLVMDEAFDEWEYPKKKWIEGWNKGEPGFQGAADFFAEWSDRDVADMVRRDRNHPSIIMWSIGNEVDYPNDPYSHPVLDGAKVGQKVYGGYLPDQPPAERLGGIAKRLSAVVRGLDKSRPVTAALAGAVMSNETEYPGTLDVVGYNYTEFRYDEDHKRYPKRVLYGSETRHDLDAWKSVRDKEFIFGQFIWTGFDYLGESGAWPSRGFTTGMIDLANRIKPRGFFRRALWAEKPVAYLGTTRWFRGLTMDAGRSWNYDDGQKVRVICYTNGDEAELFLDGKAVGERKPYDDSSAIFYWDIPYKAGELKVVVYQNGKVVATDSILPDGEASAIKVESVSALNGKYDVAVIPVSIVDDKGRLVYGASSEVTCTVTGLGKLIGLENASGDASENFGDNIAAVNHGQLVAYVQSMDNAGIVQVSFSADNLGAASVEIQIGE